MRYFNDIIILVGEGMRLKKLFVIVMVLMAVIVPGNVFAINQCEDYSVDKCPATSCRVQDGACVKAHIGDNFCSEEKVMNATRTVGYFLYIARLFIPLIVAVMGMRDLFRAVTGGDEKSAGQAAKKLGIRIAIGLAVFFVPAILHAVLTAIDDFNAILGDYKICELCLLDPFKCEPGAVDSDPGDGSGKNDESSQPDNSGKHNSDAVDAVIR